MRLLYRLIHLTGLSALGRLGLAKNGRFVLEFHGVARRRYDSVPVDLQPALTIESLRRVLRWLQRYFTFLTVEGFFHTENRGVLLTFDDGMANNAANVIPLLEEFNAPAIFFVSSQHVINPENHLPVTRKLIKSSWGEACRIPSDIARDLYDGMSEEKLVEASQSSLITIGSHTVSHPFLTKIDDESLKRELVDSKTYLEKLTGKTVDLFAYPTGDYNEKVLKAVQKAGYRAAFVEDSKGLGHPQYEIPRVGIYSGDSSYLSLKLSGLHRRSLKGAIL